MAQITQYLSHFNSDHHFSQVPCYQFALFLFPRLAPFLRDRECFRAVPKVLFFDFSFLFSKSPN